MEGSDEFKKALMQGPHSSLNYEKINDTDLKDGLKISCETSG